MTLGQYIDECGLTQRRIAGMIGVAESRLSNYCNGLIPCDEHRLAIGAAIRELTGRDVDMVQFWPTVAPQPQPEA